MPVLNWIGKDAVVAHDAQVPFRLLHDVPELVCQAVRPERSSPQGCEVEGQIDAQNSTDNLIATGRDAEEKRRIGELWERRSNGSCAFTWVEKADWVSLRNAAARCAAAQGGV